MLIIGRKLQHLRKQTVLGMGSRQGLGLFHLKVRGGGGGGGTEDFFRGGGVEF